MDELTKFDFKVEDLTLVALKSFFIRLKKLKQPARLLSNSSGEVFCCARTFQSMAEYNAEIDSTEGFKLIFLNDTAQIKSDNDRLVLPKSELENDLLPELVMSKIKTYLQDHIKDTYESIKAHEKKRSRILSKLFAYNFTDEQHLLDYALNASMELVGSKFGYIYKYSEEKKQFTLNSWSKDVMPVCDVANPKTCYELDNTGFWGEAVRQRKALILNDFEAQNHYKKGFPEGHVVLKRFMTTPIYRDNEIIAVIGSANKKEPYTLKDVEDLQILMNGVWSMVQLSDSKMQLAKLSKAVEATDASVVITDIDGNIEYANPYFYKNTGYSKEEAIGVNPRILKSGFQTKAFYTKLWDTIKAGNTWKGELLNKKKDGTLYWEQAIINPVANLNGVYTHFVAVKTDISKIKASESKYRLITENLNQVIWTADSKGSINFINKKGKEYFRTDFDNLMGNGWLSLVHDDDKVRTKNIWANAQKTGSNYHNVFRIMLDDKTHWVDVTASPTKSDTGIITGWIGIIIDITDEYITKYELKRNKLKLEEAQKIAGIGSWEFKLGDERPSWSKETFAITGWPKSKPPSLEEHGQFIHPDDFDSFISEITKAISERRKIELNIRLIVNEKIKKITFIGNLMVDASDECVGLKGIIQDVTKDVNKAIELEERNYFLELAQHAAKMGSYKINLGNGEIFWSDYIYELFEINLNREISFDLFFNCIHPDDKVRVKTAWQNSLTTLEYNIEYRIMVKDTVKWVSTRAIFTKSKYDNSISAVGVVVDITDRESLMLKIKDQNKRLQEIAWAQSHLVRAPLTNIMGLVMLFEMVKNDFDTVEQIMKNIKITAEEFDKVIKEITRKSEQLYKELAETSNADDLISPKITQTIKG